MSVQNQYSQILSTKNVHYLVAAIKFIQATAGWHGNSNHSELGPGPVTSA